MSEVSSEAIRVPPAEFPGRVCFGLEAVQAAAEEWGFNCGPGALCAIAGKSPADVRGVVPNFEQRGYTSPTMMLAALGSLQIPVRSAFQERAGVLRDEVRRPRFPSFGLVRVQWDGSWCNAGVPVPARYRRTHWVAYSGDPLTPDDAWVFDVNAMCCGGWIGYREWSQRLVPWLIGECVRGGTGGWWPTHCWEVPLP